MTSRLLIDEPPLLVLRSLATVFGLNEAIILQQMHYRQTSDKNRNHFNNRVWVRNTYEEWCQEFPFWGKNTIVRTIDKLYEQQLILTFMEQSGFRNQKFYSLNYEMLNELADLKLSSTALNSQISQASENSEIDLPKMGRSTSQNQDTSKSSSETYTYKENRGMAASQILGEGSDSIYKERPAPLSVSGSGNAESAQKAGVHASVLSADHSISGSPTTQDGLIDLSNLGRPSTQNGYVDIPNLGKSYKEAENNFKDIIPPLTPPNSKSVEDEEEDLTFRMIKVWNQLVQGKIKDAARKEVVLTEARKQALEIMFNGILSRDFAEWERYCEKISQIKFLLGHGPNGFKINIEWATNPDNALKIMEGRIYDKPTETKAVEEKSADELTSEIQDLFKTKGFPEAWLPVYQLLAEKHGQTFYASWLKACEPQPLEGNQAVLLASTTFIKDYMTTHYLDRIREAACHCWNLNIEIIIEVKK